MRYISPKHLLTFNRLQCIMSWKVELSIVTALRTSDRTLNVRGLAHCEMLLSYDDENKKKSTPGHVA
jgi:hypothetical protein